MAAGALSTLATMPSRMLSYVRHSESAVWRFACRTTLPSAGSTIPESHTISIRRSARRRPHGSPGLRFEAPLKNLRLSVPVPVLYRRKHELADKTYGQYKFHLGRLQNYCERQVVYSMCDLNVDLLETFTRTLIVNYPPAFVD